MAYLNIFQLALEEKAHIFFFSELGEDGGNRDHSDSQTFVSGAVFYTLAFMPRIISYLCFRSG